MSKIFLSHNHNDKPFVRELASYLKQYGIEAWVDEAEIKIGDSLIDKVGTAIKENAFVGVVVSRHSVSSRWVKKELELALQRELQEDRVVVLPIVLDDAELPVFLTGKLYADFSAPQKYYTELAKLLDALGAHQRPGQRVYVSYTHDSPEHKYTHDSPEHKEWVAELFRRLVLDGKNVTFDYSFVQPGRDFLESIFSELARTICVLLIVTPTYKIKALESEKAGSKGNTTRFFGSPNLAPT